MADQPPFIDANELPWHEPPGHINGMSRYLVTPEDQGSAYFDFRLSRYPSGGRVELHTHERAEHVYFVISGTAAAVCGDEKRVLGPGTAMFVRPGEPHSFENTAEEDLVFVVVTSPPSEIAR